MSDCYEWFDPHEARQEARRWKDASRDAEDRGRRSVLRQLSGVAGEKVSQGIEMACEEIGRKIAMETVFPVAARESHAAVRGLSEVIADEFRRACSKVNGGIDWSRRGSADIEVHRDVADLESAMTIRYQTVEPIRLAFSLRI